MLSEMWDSTCSLAWASSLTVAAAFCDQQPTCHPHLVSWAWLLQVNSNLWQNISYGQFKWQLKTFLFGINWRWHFSFICALVILAVVAALRSSERCGVGARVYTEDVHWAESRPGQDHLLTFYVCHRSAGFFFQHNFSLRDLVIFHFGIFVPLFCWLDYGFDHC